MHFKNAQSLGGQLGNPYEENTITTVSGAPDEEQQPASIPSPAETVLVNYL